jgi:hypothetical protein
MTLYLSEQQSAYVRDLAKELPVEKRDTFIGAVQSRLSGRPADETVGRVASLIFSEIRRHEILARRA